MLRREFVLLFLLLTLVALIGPPAVHYWWPWLQALFSPFNPPILVSNSADYRVEVVTEGLESPWAMVFLPDGRIFVTERPGRLRVIENRRLVPTPIAGVPRISFTGGEGGLLGMTLHPNYAENRLVYLAYTVDSSDGEMTRLARFKVTPEGLQDMKVILPGMPGGDLSGHFGSRVRFGPDGKLYATLGERVEPERAQDLADLNGKTLRLNDDGTVPPDNPFVARDGIRPEVFSYGHRNPQGIAFQPGTGLMFQTEHGPGWSDAPGGGDEVNIVEAGRNYGWPVIHHRQTREGMVSPLLEYTPAVAPSGAMFYTGEPFPEWQGSFFFATLAGRALFRVALDGRKVVHQEIMLERRYGRLRDVAQGPDGFIYVLTSDTDAYGPGRAGGDRLLRLVPAK